jgi:hypothetical protein
MSDLAVIVPTRSRPQNVAPILKAWSETGAWGVADLWWILDADDMHLSAYMDALQETPGNKLMHIVPEWKPLVPKLNASAVGLRNEFQYRFLAFMGDDHVPRTTMWAHHIIEDHVMRGAGIVYGRDGIQDQRLPTWWSMDGQIIDRLGRMVPAPVQHLYCDNSIKLLGERSGQLGYDDRILIEHMHPIAGKAAMDLQYERVNRRQQYERDEQAFRGWVASGLDQDATLLADIRR